MLFSLLFCAVCVGINLGNIFWVSLFKAGWKVILVEVLITLICLGLFLAQIHIYMSTS